MLDLGRPVAFYPGLSKHVGGVNACLFVCQLLYWSARTESDIGVYKTAEEWTRETGLSYKEQATARRKLRELGLITEVEKRLEHKIYYLLDVEALNKLIESANSPTGHPRKSHRAVRGEPEGVFDLTEITTETTAESIKRSAPKPALDISAFPEQPSKEVWADYVSHRKAKKAPLNQTIVNQIAKELALAVATGWSVDDALAEAMAAGWQGLKSQWLENRVKPNSMRQAGGGFNKQTQLEARNAQAAADFVNDIQDAYQ